MTARDVLIRHGSVEIVLRDHYWFKGRAVDRIGPYAGHDELLQRIGERRELELQHVYSVGDAR
ncbi:hypothetical protein [Natronorarus salvus]|uniref:hypothetical protein n=1 Tax=Natronorarus salvus TaxID=3117733 RepID=UPI002F2643EB